MERIRTSGKFKIIFGGFFLGLILGIVARIWMRWISTDPEFSWSGSIFIVGTFTIFFTNQSLVLLLRRRTLGKKRTTLVRTAGIIFSLPIFSAAGGIMFPTVALASVGIWNRQLGLLTRRVLIWLSLIIPIKISFDILSDFGWTFATFGRILLFVFIYSVVIFATRPTMTPFSEVGAPTNRLSKRTKIGLTLGILVIVALFYLSTAGIPGG